MRSPLADAMLKISDNAPPLKIVLYCKNDMATCRIFLLKIKHFQPVLEFSNKIQRKFEGNHLVFFGTKSIDQQRFPYTIL